jgi:hypothetical protein
MKAKPHRHPLGYPARKATVEFGNGVALVELGLPVFGIGRNGISPDLSNIGGASRRGI